MSTMVDNHDAAFEERSYPQVGDPSVLEGLRALRSTVKGLLATMEDKGAVYVGKQE